jgi:hypothetical protein
MKLGTFILATELISTACFINLPPSPCVYVCHLIIANLGTRIISPELIAKACFINLSHLSVSPYFYEAWHMYHGTRGLHNGVLHKSYTSLSACVCHLIITKLGTCIMALDLISTACFMNLSHQFVSVCVSPYHYEVWHMFHGTRAHPNGPLHKSSH